jgi:Flp pilus assembly protein TadD
LAIFVLTLVAYIPAIQAGYIWDDDSYVTQNAALTTVDGLRQIWLDRSASPQYYPLVFTSFWLEHHIWGLSATGYHVVNILFHLFSALLLWRLLRSLELPGAWLAAAVFAIHPVHVESVAWITERKNVLSGFLYLAAVASFFRYAGIGTSVGGEAKRHGGTDATAAAWPWALTTALLFLAALASKSVTSTLPAVLLLLAWWQRGRVGRRVWALLLPLFAIGAGAGLSTAWIEKHHVGAAGAEWAFSLPERCLIAGKALWFYVGKILWPHPLIFFYPRWQIHHAPLLDYLQPLLALLLLLLLWFGRRRLGRGPLVAALIYAGTIFPALGFIDVYPMRFSFVADHFQYLASIPIIVLGSVLAASLGRRSLSPLLRSLFAALLLLAAGRLTYVQARAYANPETLWRTTLAHNPAAFAAQSELGLILYRRGDLETAAGYFERAIELKPDYYEALNNLGIIQNLRAHHQAAIDLFRRALDVSPEYVPAWVNLGTAEYRLGRTEEAIEALKEALRIFPDGAETLCNYAAMLAVDGRVEEAAAAIERAAELGVVTAPSRLALAAAHLRKREFQSALVQFQRGIDADFGNATLHNGKGVALAHLGRLEEAALAFEKALALDPRNVEYSANLGRARRTLARKPSPEAVPLPHRQAPREQQKP